MADVVTGTVTGFVNNYPEQTTASLSDIRLEQMKQASDNLDAVRDARHAVMTDASRNAGELSRQVDAIDDTLTAQLITLARDTQDIRAQVISAQQAMVAGFMGAAKDSEINALKTQVELAKQSTYLSDKIDADGEKTRALVNSLKEQELNRILIERNSELVEERFGRRFWRHGADQGQWAALNSQLQAFQSQLQETRQGMVNFGTMAGVGQTSTSNNVR
jgi:hypothetical protein